MTFWFDKFIGISSCGLEGIIVAEAAKAAKVAKEDGSEEAPKEEFKGDEEAPKEKFEGNEEAPEVEFEGSIEPSKDVMT